MIVHVSVARIGTASVHVRLMEGPHHSFRLDVRRYDGLEPGAGFNISARYVGAIRAALAEAEAEAERLGWLREEAA